MNPRNTITHTRRLLFPTYGWIIIAVFLTGLVFLASLNNGWVNWDDDEYVLRNEMVHSLSLEHIGQMFTTAQQVGLYHPLTMLSLAIDHSIWGKEAFGYHLTSLLLHLLNVALVFIFIKKLGLDSKGAFLVALLFGIHPMHVESVCWISARKDVLYVFFLLLALLAYMKYRASQSRKVMFYGFAIFCFIASLLSKSMAFTFPLVLLLLDYYEKRAFSKSLILEKIPFFILAAAALWLAKFGQQDSDSMMAVTSYPLYKTIFIGSYNVLYYGIKMLVPVHLAAFHPFPFLGKIELPWYFYASIIPCLALGWWLIRQGKTNRKLVFGMLLFLVSIGPVLQIVPFGKTVSSERYTYLAYVGLFFLLAIAIQWLYTWLKSQNKRYTHVLTMLLAAWLILLAFQTWNQSKYWKNGETLWSQVIDRYPEHYWAYRCRGIYYNVSFG
jgi:hypothetical protein